MELEQIIHGFALAMQTVDQRGPQAASRRTASRLYQPGIGPFAEDDAVAMTVSQRKVVNGAAYLSAGGRRYPTGGQTCDLVLGELPDWAIEVKLARVGRDSGTLAGGVAGVCDGH